MKLVEKNFSVHNPFKPDPKRETYRRCNIVRVLQSKVARCESNCIKPLVL